MTDSTLTASETAAPHDGRLFPEPATRRPSRLADGVRHKWWLLAIVLLACVVGAAVIGDRQAVTYTAESQLSVGTSDPGTQAQPGYVQAAQSLASSYSRIAESQLVLEPVSRAADLPLATVRGRITATPIVQNPIVAVKADGATASEAIRLAKLTSKQLTVAVADLQKAQSSDKALLDRFREASARSSSSQEALDSLERRRRNDRESVRVAEIVRASSLRDTAKLQAETLGSLYTEQRQRSTGPAEIQVLDSPSSASNDRNSLLQRWLFVGLVAGLGLGTAFATLADRRRRRNALN